MNSITLLSKNTLINKTIKTDIFLTFFVLQYSKGERNYHVFYQLLSAAQVKTFM